MKMIIRKIYGCVDCPRRSRMYRDKEKYGELWGTHCCCVFSPPKSLEISIMEILEPNYIPKWCPLEEYIERKKKE